MLLSALNKQEIQRKHYIDKDMNMVVTYDCTHTMESFTSQKGLTSFSLSVTPKPFKWSRAFHCVLQVISTQASYNSRIQQNIVLDATVSKYHTDIHIDGIPPHLETILYT